MTCTLPMMPLSLPAAFAAGVASSVHCVAMCGGIAGALALRARAIRGSTAARVRHLAAHQAGRIGGYALFGALGGAFGRILGALGFLWHVEWILRLIAAAIILAVGLQFLAARPWNPLERLGARFWRHLAPLAGRFASAHRGNALLTGLSWSLMPCGLVYSMLGVAALSGSATMGACMMLSFGAGTLPAVVSGACLLARGPVYLRAWAPRAAGASFVAFGVWTAIGALR